jgi:Lrp/AsnC family transcriptional regulator, leucine-responsive regulatory protein
VDPAGHPLDALDLQLLALLEVDGRMSHAQLARRVGRSRSAVQERIGRLERLGHIAGYTIRRPRSIRPVRAYLLVVGSAASHDQLAAALAKLPQVSVCDSVSGELDLVLQIQAEELAEVERVRTLLARMQGVARIRMALVVENRLDRR